MSWFDYPASSSDPSAPPVKGQDSYQQQQQYAGSYNGYGGGEQAAAAAGRSSAYGQTDDAADSYAQYSGPSPPHGKYNNNNTAAASPYGAPSSYVATSSSFPAASGGASPAYLQRPVSYGHPSDGQSYGQESAAYGQTYPPAQGQSQYRPPGVAASFPPGTEPEIVRIFEQTDSDRSGYIDGAELGRVLSTDGYTPFSPRTVRLILHLFAENQTDPTKVGPAGFVKAWRALKHWQTVFEKFDRDRSRTIEQDELRNALFSLGFAVPPQVLQMLVSKYDSTGQSTSIRYDNFIQCGLIVKVC
jgi:calcium-binding protein CML